MVNEDRESAAAAEGHNVNDAKDEKKQESDGGDTSQPQDSGDGKQQQEQDGEEDDARMANAACIVQKKYRGWRSRREAFGLNLQIPQAMMDKDKNNSSSNSQDGRREQQEDNKDKEASDVVHENKNSPLSPNTRWNDALSSGGMKRMNSEQLQNKNDPKSRWQRTGFYAERITGTDGRREKGVDREDDGSAQSLSAGAKAAALAPNKQMEAQYWLELVDSKHRYGTNLKSYHDAWNKSNTKNNFFYWLDNGSGKELDLPDCPREQLDRERVTYLSAEQRRNYLVDVGKDGLLYWHRNGRKVDTAKGKWEDLGNGRGIGYKGEKDHLPPPKDEDVTSSSSSSSSSSMYSSSDSDAEAQHPDQYKKKHYMQKPDNDESKKHYFTSPKVVMDLLLRKTINSNTWIYVSDTSGRLFIGIKSTGGFQHSSFMYGATVASAGLLKAKNGQLTSLSPLSGHYRAGTAHFKAFHKSLQERGVDMSRVSVSKSLMVIRAIEKYGSYSKKKKAFKKRMRHRLHLGPSNEEEKQAEDEKRNKQIEQDAKNTSPPNDSVKKQNREGPADRHNVADGSHSSSSSENNESNDQEHEDIVADMHDDIKKEEMTDQQRAERAIALIRSAFSKGLKGEKKEVVKDARQGDNQDTSNSHQNDESQGKTG